MAHTVGVNSFGLGVAVAHLVAASVMTGLIWTIHALHYPLFSQVGPETYPAYQSGHMSRVTALLLLPWSVEIVSALVLVAIAPSGRLRVLAFAGVALVGFILLVTALGAAPIHGQLLDGFDAALHDRLLFWDLLRTLAWTLRVAVAVVIVWLALPDMASPA